MNGKLWREVKKSEINHDADARGGFFTLCHNNYGTVEEHAKVRYIAQGFADSKTPFLVHDVTAFRPSSIRLLLSVADTLKVRLSAHDLTQAYLQSTERMARKLYLVPKPEDGSLFHFSEDEVLLLLNLLCAFCDSDDYWYATMEQNVTTDLCMKPTKSDSSEYMRFLNGKLTGLTGKYVEDNPNAGHEMFEDKSMMTLKLFEAKPRIYDNFSFFGTQVSTLHGNLC